MSSATSHAIKHRATADVKDVFYTPCLVAQTHINSITPEGDEHWYDPFAGKGIYFDNFPTSNKSKTEITDGTDFFAQPLRINEKRSGIICSNPPYSIIDAVLSKTLELKPRVFSYLLLEGKMTPKRLEAINAAGYSLTGMYMCKVFKWYGMAVAYTFTYVGPGKTTNEAKIIYDRIVHR
jgi:hypothetical protein